METPNLPTPPPTGEAPVRRNPLIPQDQDQKAALALFLAAAWKLNPQLVLLWITQAEFEAKAQQYAAAVKARNQAAALRPQQTLSFAQYDQQIQDGLDDVKAYLREEFGKENAKAYFAEFGIETHGEHYELPLAQKERADALEMLVAALTKYGFQDRKYGKAYWEPIAAGYAALTGKSRQDRAALSGLVGEKDGLETEIDEVLSAMLCLLEAQYRKPEALAAKRRELGFQREYN